MTVDEFIWEDFRADPYATWVLMLMRLPAANKHRWAEWIKQYKLFCTYEGKRYRVTGASRFGDVWLHSDFEKDYGYEHRIPDLKKCSNWSATPDAPIHDDKG